MFNPQDCFELTRYLLIALGLEIQPNTGILIDQETKNQLAFDGKFIKVNIDPQKALYISEHDVRLDPIDPKCTKMVELLFGNFLDANSAEGINLIPEVFSYSFDRDMATRKNRLNIKFIDGTKWVGNWYLNKILCYLEAIFILEGTFPNINLYVYDIDRSLYGENEES